MNEVATLSPVTSRHDRPFVLTKEYRRFEEFCEACRRERYIGVCYGPPGVGKTVSARHYAQWDLLEGQDPLDQNTVVPMEVAGCRTLLFTPRVSNTPRLVREQIEHGRLMLRSLVGRAEHDAMSSERPDFSERCELILVDEADRLTTQSLEELRDHYDREKVGLVLIGMPGLEKRLSRYPQLYSRIGFAHAFRPLSQEETLFVLRKHGHGWGQDWNDDDFTDQEALAAITRITAGNFRLIDRLMAQVVRIMRLNQLNTVNKEVVDAARECLVIGSM
ncbi:MAG: AAA family ATPase [Alphaproteobacteria bacterium GM202ARS2]|nr:AAA family ATPase [Alphaproteobacteria bacterium GM202ARS2]